MALTYHTPSNSDDQYVHIECAVCGWRGRDLDDGYPNQVIDDAIAHADTVHRKPIQFSFAEVSDLTDEEWFAW